MDTQTTREKLLSYWADGSDMHKASSDDVLYLSLVNVVGLTGASAEEVVLARGDEWFELGCTGADDERMAGTLISYVA